MKARRFTAVELIAVMVIIMILAGMSLGIAGYVKIQARRSRSLAQMKALELALSRFNTEYGYFPQQATAGAFTVATFKTLKDSNGRNYIDDLSLFPDITTLADTDPVKDPFGAAYQYQCPGAANRNAEMYDLWSHGPDGQNGTNDDLTNWQRN